MTARTDADDFANDHQRAWVYRARMMLVHEALNSLFIGIRGLLKAETERDWCVLGCDFTDFNHFWFDEYRNRTVNPPRCGPAPIIAEYERLRAQIDDWSGERTVLPFGSKP